MEKLQVTIGIVDDEQLVCLYLKNAISSMGTQYQVLGTCNNGEEAISAWKDNPPAIIITDIMMSNMDGLEMLSKIRCLGWQTEVIVLSGHDSFSYAQRAISLDVFRYLLKPVNTRELTQTIVDAATQYQNKNATQRRNTFEQLCNQTTMDMCAMVVRFGHVGNTPPQNASLLDSLSVLIKSKLNENEQLWVEGNHLLVLVQNSGASVDYNRLYAMVDLSVGLLSGQYSANELFYYTGIGSRGKNIDELVASRKEAYLAAEYAFFLSKNGHYLFSHVPPKSHFDENNLTYYRDIATQLTYSIISNDKKGLNSIMQTHFLHNKYVHRFADRESFYSEFGMLYLLVGLMLQEKGVDEILRPVEEFLSILRYKHSFFAAVEFLKDEIVQACQELSEMDTEGNSIIVKIKQYLLKNYEKDITLKELSDTFYLCTSYLSSYFKKETGQTISDYLIMLRIQEAKKLLQRPELTVEEIAKKIGYSNGRYFSTLFKKMTGLSPVQYRLRSINENMGDVKIDSSKT